MAWAHALPPLLAAFLASLVECTEALTIILAVGGVLGWRGAIAGAGAAIATLLAAIALLGPMIALIPLRAIHAAIGALLLAFGARWLRKAVLRAAAIIPHRDEDLAYARQIERLSAAHSSPDGAGGSGFLPAFQVTMIEGIEVIFIVIAVGAADRSLLLPASLGAAAALLLVATLGAMLHKPIARIPENTLKFTVGVLTCAFGLFWLGEATGIHWPGDDWSILALAAVILATALIAVRIVGKVRIRTPPRA